MPRRVIQGSSPLQLPERGLLDRPMQMVGQHIGTTGNVLPTYQPAGKLKAGALAAPEPGASELERRKKMEAETW